MNPYVVRAHTRGNGVTEVAAGTDMLSWCGLEVHDLDAGQSITISIPDSEFLVLPLWGSARVTVADDAFLLAGRASVFSGPTDFVYVGLGHEAIVQATQAGRFAFPSARARSAMPARYQPASRVAVELRGAGVCSRQVNNFCTPGEFEADRLIACEVITPGGNWSSFPPHKHDEETANETELEEIYYYEFASSPQGTPGFGYQRVYGTEQRPIDVHDQVYGGDVVLIPHGWHGPSMAIPGIDMYYLNVMAGPGPERAWRICDDPTHAWIRTTWADQLIDPRLPFRSDRPAQ